MPIPQSVTALTVVEGRRLKSSAFFQKSITCYVKQQDTRPRISKPTKMNKPKQVKPKSNNLIQLVLPGQSDLKQTKTTRVVRIQRKGGVIVQNCDVYIGRECTMGGWTLSESKWHNPFTVRECGTVEKCVHKYREYILNNTYLLNSLDELEGKTLGCWCKRKPSDPCHGDVLVELLNERTRQR